VPALLSLAPKCPALKLIISMDPLDADEAPGFSKKALLSQWAQEKGVLVYSMAEVEAIGQANPRPMVPPTRDNYITINYTSGTTGNPKGVLLTHGNCIAAASCAMTNSLHPLPTDVLLSYLPLAHIYARVAENYALWGGSAIGYFHGSILEVGDDLKVLRPTTFISVPRLYNRFYNGIKEATIEQPGVKGALSRHVLSKKLEQIRAGGSNKHAFYDRIWAKKIQAALGLDRCRAMVSGSAPIAKDVLQTLRAVFSNDFIEGYGLTETYAVALGQTQQDNSAGNCGPPTISIECKLRDVPEMGYLSTDKPVSRGELLVRGPNVFAGYYKNPEQTAAVIDEEGWFATGDVCSVDELGRFAIIDRVKNLLKLAQGEYVSPEKIENIYIANLPIIGHGLVHGDSLQTYLVAIIGVDRDQFSTFASNVLKRNVSPTDDKAILEACAHKAVKRAVLKAMDAVAKKAKLAGFERVKNVHLCIEPFTIDNDLLTPT
jgi:long-chain acyl-CoA synthetase